FFFLPSLIGGLVSAIK
uniref:Peptide Im-6 n=2 Tax=Isometrus maculatus TaxID=497827 RepID=NDB4C_ISOMC|nr:RecName: Full=Peptide Im-6 [Isometrus maculatus]